MLKNYFKTALRNLLREKTSTLLNLSGLAIGISCSIILFLLISHHNSFDTFHQKKDRVYRIVNESEGNHGTDYQPGVPAVLPDAFRIDFPQAEAVAFTSYRADALILIPQKDGTSKKFQEKSGVVYTEPSIFQIFDRQILQGDFKSLANPNEAIISTDLAIKYFGHANVLGELIKHGNDEYKIAGIMANAPANTDLPFNLMLSYITVKKEREEQGWGSIWSDEQCYFLLKEGESIQDVNAGLIAFTQKHRGDNKNKTLFMTQSLMDLHFDDRFETYTYNTVSRGTLFALGVVAGILILTACINFVNLSTAEAIKRSKEVGVRKTMGSSRGQLIFQFLGETTLITAIAVLVALGLTQIALTFVNPFLELELQLNLISNRDLLLYLVSITIIVALFSGVYPAFVISGFKPALALKNQLNSRSSSGYYLRSGLVVLQFFISQVFIIGTIVLIKQTNFIHQKDLGFERDAILTVPLPDEGERDLMKLSVKRKTLRNQTESIAGIELASLGSTPPSSNNVSKTIAKIEGDPKDYITQVKQVDGNYADLYKLNIVAGTNVHDLDSAMGFVVNETFAKTVGYTEPRDIVGKSLTVWRREYPIVGVVRDFHTVSLQSQIEPTVMFNNVGGYNTLSLKINMNQVESVLKEVKLRWEASYPDQLFEYHFLEDHIREFYESERKMSGLLTVFTSMAIFIGCLGLFGLASFMANQKTKEIGVRKVLGATVESIVLMFSREFGKLILLGFLAAAPLGWFATQSFLNEFAYQVPVGLDVFALGLAITIVIALFTVGYKSYRAAISNPVKSLRYE